MLKIQSTPFIWLFLLTFALCLLLFTYHSLALSVSILWRFLLTKIILWSACAGARNYCRHLFHLFFLSIPCEVYVLVSWFIAISLLYFRQMRHKIEDRIEQKKKIIRTQQNDSLCGMRDLIFHTTVLFVCRCFDEMILRCSSLVRRKVNEPKMATITIIIVIVVYVDVADAKTVFICMMCYSKRAHLANEHDIKLI